MSAVASLEDLKKVEKELKDLDHLDELIYRFLITGDKSVYDDAKEMFFYILENYIVNHIK